MSEPTPLLAPLKPKSAAARLWRERAFIDDVWRQVGDDEAITVGGRSIVSLIRWRADATLRAASGAQIGVRLSPGETLDLTSDDPERLSVIALPFPKFSDGRSYSAARRLREAGFKGEVRATGDVLLDQLPLMLRAGFDAFEITHAATLAALERGEIPVVSHVYQSGAEHSTTANLFTQRAARRPTGARS